MNSIETVAKNIRLGVMQYAFFHLFPVAVAGTAMIMDIRTAKLITDGLFFHVCGTVCLYMAKEYYGNWIFYNGKRNAVISYDPLCLLG